MQQETNKPIYIIDMEEFMSFISKTPSSEKNVNTITTYSYGIGSDDYDSEFEDFNGKEVTENKSTMNEIMNNVRYDFIRILLNTIMCNEDNKKPIIMSEKDMDFGQRLAFQTLLNYNIIKQIN